MSDPLRDLLAKQAITEQLYNYCRAMDRIDVGLGTQVWHEDGRADYGPLFSGSGGEFVVWVSAAHRRLVATSHQLTNVLVEVDGELARSESYVTAHRVRADDGGRLTSKVACGRYVDRWSHRAGRWAIDERVYLHDLEECHPAGEEPSPLTM